MTVIRKCKKVLLCTYLLLQKTRDSFIAHTTATLYYMICYFLQDECTPIHLASRRGCVQVVEKLISLGANVNVVDKVSVNY